MSLQHDNFANAFALTFKDLIGNWDIWNINRKKDVIKRLIQNQCNRFMQAPDVRYGNASSDCGSFSNGPLTWEIEIGEGALLATTLKDKLELCSTIYHETRHAEQLFRVAQGLAAGMINHGVPKNKLIKVLAKTGGMNTVTQKRFMFENDLSQYPFSANMLVELVWVPLNVANNAVNRMNDFNTWINSGRPTWYKRNPQEIVTRWADTTLRKSTERVEDAGQSAPFNNGRAFRFYRDTAVEYDSHQIEKFILRKLRTKMPTIITEKLIIDLTKNEKNTDKWEKITDDARKKWTHS